MYNTHSMDDNHTHTMQPRIENEIAFLKMRIQAIKNHHTPNHSMLRNFEKMLEKRENVLLKMHNESKLLRINGSAFK